jgi:hypothetical protein
LSSGGSVIAGKPDSTPKKGRLSYPPGKAPAVTTQTSPSPRQNPLLEGVIKSNDDGARNDVLTQPVNPIAPDLIVA